MKYKKIYPVILCIIFFSISACKKSISVSNEVLDSLIGKWEWEYSSGGWSGGIVNPEDDLVQTIEFKKNGRRITRENDKKVESKTYKIVKDESIFSSEKEIQLRVYNKGNFSKERLTFSESDSLMYLSDECYDCYTSVYSRVN